MAEPLSGAEIDEAEATTYGIYAYNETHHRLIATIRGLEAENRALREERDAAIEVRDAPLPQTMMALVNARREARGLEAENAKMEALLWKDRGPLNWMRHRPPCKAATPENALCSCGLSEWLAKRLETKKSRPGLVEPTPEP